MHIPFGRVEVGLGCKEKQTVGPSLNQGDSRLFSHFIDGKGRKGACMDSGGQSEYNTGDGSQGQST